MKKTRVTTTVLSEMKTMSESPAEELKQTKLTSFFHYVTRNQISKRRKSHGENDELQLAEIYPTIMDLPTHIIIEILSRLPFKVILILRCVCKTLRILISNPTRFHFSRANVELFVSFPVFRAETLHWVDLETMHINADDDVCVGRKTVINAPFYLPRPKCNNRFEPKWDYEIVNSCNGFLCLSKPFSKNPCIVCNPIIGEYITIPKPEKEDKKMCTVTVSAFGYSLKSNQYKVLHCLFNSSVGGVAQVYTLGSSSWRRIGYAPPTVIGGWFSTYLNGVIHWVCNDIDGHNSDFIMAFDFEVERFHVVPAPLHFGEEQKEDENLHNMNMGELEGCLCICDFIYLDQFDIWVMKDYGVQESWTKQFAIDNYSLGCCRPIKYAGNADVLILYERWALAFYDPAKDYFRFLRADISMRFEALAHTPSFLSLKDAVGGDNLKVQDVRSRRAESQLREYAETLSLVEISEDRRYY